MEIKNSAAKKQKSKHSRKGLSLKQKGEIPISLYLLKRIHHLQTLHVFAQPFANQHFSVKGKKGDPQQETQTRDPPHPSLFREGVITIANGYHSRFSNISSLPKQGGLGWVSYFL